jgi:hypothetical protein
MREANKKSLAPAAKSSLWASAILALVFTAGCASEPGPNPELPRIGLLSQFTSHNLCSLGASPEIRVYDVPPGVTTYRVKITSVGALIGAPWQIDVPANGQTIPEGGLAGYEAPCPPERQVFRYRFEVMALTADGSPVAYGWNFFTATWLGRVAELERQRLMRGLPATSPVPVAVGETFWAPRADKPPFFNN